MSAPFLMLNAGYLVIKKGVKLVPSRTHPIPDKVRRIKPKIIIWVMSLVTLMKTGTKS